MNHPKPCRTTIQTDNIDETIRSKHPFLCAGCGYYTAHVPSQHMNECAEKRVAEMLKSLL